MRPRKMILTIELDENVIPISWLRKKDNVAVKVRRMGDIWDDIPVVQVQANVVKSKKGK